MPDVNPNMNRNWENKTFRNWINILWSICLFM